MSDHTSFIEIFPGCEGLKDLCGGLNKAYVTDVAVSAAEMTMSVAAHFERMPAPAEITNICERLRRDYGFNSVELIPDYPQMKSAPAPSGVKPKSDSDKPKGDVLMGRPIKSKPVPMSSLTLDSGNVVIEGDVFAVTSRKLTKRDGAVLCFDITDRTGSIRVSRYLRADDDQSIINAIKEGDHLFISGVVNYSRYDEDMALEPRHIMKGKKKIRTDDAEVKRVELHMHTRFSALDALTDPAAIVKRAAYWGMPAIAVTDHGVCQAFPDMWQAGMGIVDFTNPAARDWYCGYDVGNADYVRLPGESDPEPQYFNLASPEMFNLTWYTHVGSTNYHYSALACSNDDYYVAKIYSGTELYKPQASRFDSIARSALLGSYEAYYERLYYASQGQRNGWEVADWGEYDDPQRFNFNPTNDLVATTPRFHPDYPTDDFENAEDGPLRPIPASRRLTDATNIAELVRHVRDLFPAKVEAYSMSPDDTPYDFVVDARPFVFRPHWISDERDYHPGDGFGMRIWWASTVPPPAMAQEVWGTYQLIDSSTLGLFPNIEDFTTITDLRSVGIPFSCYATTLDMLCDSDEFSCYGTGSASPCHELFGAVVTDCPDAANSAFVEVLPFNFHGMTVPMFLTNAYPRAAASVPNRRDAFERYVDVGTDTDVVRRMVPGRLDLVNQLMSVMDRTIMIPSMHIAATNIRTTATHRCEYLGEPATIKAVWVDDDWEITGWADEYSLTGTPQMNIGKETNTVSGIHLEISATSTHSSPGSPQLGRTGFVEITQEWLDYNLPDEPSMNIVMNKTADNTGIWLWLDPESSLDALHVPMPDTVDGEFIFQLTPAASIRRKYAWSEPESADVIGVALGPHQPGFEAGNRVDACRYAILDAMTSKELHSPKWRSEVDDFEAGELPGVLNDHASLCFGTLEAKAHSERTDYDAPESYIPLPSSATLRFPAGAKPSASGELGIAPIEPEGRPITNILYHFTLPVPGETVNASHTGHWSLELSRKDYEHIHYIVHTFDSNMVETVEEDDWVSDPREVAPAPPEYFDYGTVIESRTSPDPIGLVFTNSYPPTVTLTGEAVTNMSFRDDVDAYDLEVWHEKEAISYIFELDHTRDWSVINDYGYVPYPDFKPIDPVTSNSTTTIELTVTNNLPGDAREFWVEELSGWESDILVLVSGGEKSAYIVHHNSLTGEDRWEKKVPPIKVGVYTASLRVVFDGVLDADIEADHDAWDESIFFRVMTQVDWLWNYMKLEKEEQ